MQRVEGYQKPKTYATDPVALLDKHQARYAPIQHDGRTYITDGWVMVEASESQLARFLAWQYKKYGGCSPVDVQSGGDRIFRDITEDLYLSPVIDSAPVATYLYNDYENKDNANPEHVTFDCTRYGLAIRFYAYAQRYAKKHGWSLRATPRGQFAALTPTGYIAAVFNGVESKC